MTETWNWGQSRSLLSEADILPSKWKQLIFFFFTYDCYFMGKCPSGNNFFWKYKADGINHWNPIWCSALDWRPSKSVVNWNDKLVPGFYHLCKTWPLCPNPPDRDMRSILIPVFQTGRLWDGQPWGGRLDGGMLKSFTTFFCLISQIKQLLVRWALTRKKGGTRRKGLWLTSCLWFTSCLWSISSVWFTFFFFGLLESLFAFALQVAVFFRCSNIRRSFYTSLNDWDYLRKWTVVHLNRCVSLFYEAPTFIRG